MVSLNNESYYTDNCLSVMIIGNIFGSLVMFLEMIGFGGYRPIHPALFSFQRERKIELREVREGEPMVPLNPSFIFDIRIYRTYWFHNRLTIQ